MSKYIVIQVECLECEGDGDAKPCIMIVTDDLEEAKSYMKPSYANDYDRFIVDAEYGDISLTTLQYWRQGL